MPKRRERDPRRQFKDETRSHAETMAALGRAAGFYDEKTVTPISRFFRSKSDPKSLRDSGIEDAEIK